MKRTTNAKRQSGRSSAPKTGKISAQEIEDIEERSSPRVPVIYEIVRRLGEQEMERPPVSLWWSGVAAGLSMSFSLLAEALLRIHLPDAPWRPLVSGLGYTVGFIMVVLGRQQLFTETTVTVVLPVIAEFNRRNVFLLLRMWGIVLAANIAGTLLAALLSVFAPVVTPELRDAMVAASGHLLHHTWIEMLFMAVPAGFLVATMVWLIPTAQGAQFYVIALMTYLIGIGGFMHIVAGSMEAFMLLLAGQMGAIPLLFYFIVPVLIGNVVGGTALFALLAYAQVMKEI